MAGWRKMLLALAAVFVLAGGGLRVWASAGDAEQTGSVASGERAETQTTFPTETSPGTPPGAREDPAGGSGSGDDESIGVAEDDAMLWSGFFMRGGFGLFVGFCIGFPGAHVREGRVARRRCARALPVRLRISRLDHG